MNAFMAVTSLIAASVSIWGSVLGCKVTCCGRTVTGVRITGLLSRHLLCILIYQHYCITSSQALHLRHLIIENTEEDWVLTFLLLPGGSVA